MRKSVLITGINGFLGSSLSRVLCSRDLRVVGTVRNIINSPSPHHYYADRVLTVSEIADQTSWDLASQKITTIVHCAAIASSKGAPEAFIKTVNVDATARLARRAAQEGVERFIFISTAKVHGETTYGRPCVETDLCCPSDSYARSKFDAELELEAIQKESGMTVVIVRPALIYGPGVKGTFRQLMQAVSRGIPLPLGSLMNKRSMIALENVSDMIGRCVTAELSGFEVFLASDPDALPISEWVRELSAALSHPSRLLPFPAGAFRLGAAIFGATREYEKLCTSFEVDSEKARRVLDWCGPQSRLEAMRATAHSYLAESGRAS